MSPWETSSRPESSQAERARGVPAAGHRTCAAVTTITQQLRAQYVLVPAAAFPPHATLAGSLALDGPADRALESLLGALDGVLTGRPSFSVANRGIRRLGPVLVYDVHHLWDEPNAALVELATAVDAAVRPLLLRPTPPGPLASDVHDPVAWRGHLSLASHELHDRADLRDEVRDSVEGLAVPYPPDFDAEVVTLHRFDHPTWTGPWWTDFGWRHVRSWVLPPPATAGS